MLHKHKNNFSEWDKDLKNRISRIILKEEKELKTEVNGVVFEWDDNKDKLNIKNHGISFKEALYVFFDEYYLEDFDEVHSNSEDRYNIIGRIKQNKVICEIDISKTGRARRGTKIL